MIKVTLGHISPDLTGRLNWRDYLGLDFPPNQEKLLFGADAFYEPIHNLVGVAFSWHFYDAYPLGQRDVQLAFDTIRTALPSYGPSLQNNSLFLRELLLKVIQAFKELKISPKDHHAIPILCIALAQFQENHLSVASVGGVNVFIIHTISQRLTPIWQESEPTPPVLTSNLPSAEIDLYEQPLQPGSLILVATESLDEVISEANLSKFYQSGFCEPEKVKQHLLETLKSQPGNRNDPPGTPRPGRLTDYLIGYFGAAWAVVCVEPGA